MYVYVRIYTNITSTFLNAPHDKYSNVHTHIRTSIPFIHVVLSVYFLCQSPNSGVFIIGNVSNRGHSDLLIIIEDQFQVFQVFSSSKLVLETVESCLVNWYSKPLKAVSWSSIIMRMAATVVIVIFDHLD